jgi:hemerythrin-like metal-binding protein/PAS domain S-box-containing protein
MTLAVADRGDPGEPSAESVARALAAELFSRTGAGAPIGLLAIVAVCYPHSSSVALSTLLFWALLLAMPLVASTFFARHALRVLERGASPMRLVNTECIMAGASGAAWGLLPVLFTSAAADDLYFFRLMVMCTAVTFVIPVLSVFLRCWVAYVGAMWLIALPILFSLPESAPLRGILFVSLGVFLTMALGLAINSNQRIVRAARDHLAVRRLTETLTASQAQLQLRIEHQTKELSVALASLQEKEALLSQSQRLSAVGYFIFDLDTRTFRTSSLFDEIFGVGPDDPRTFQNWVAGIHPFHRERICNMADELRREGGTAEWIYPITRPSDGKVRWVRNRSEVELDAAGRIANWFGNAQDITDQKLAEIELEHHRNHLEQMVGERTRELVVAKETAEVANAAKDTFLATISHELRTPLNGVIGMAGLARGIATDPKQRDYLDKIVRSGKNLNRVINDLLDLSKIAAGHMELEVLPFSPRALVQHCTSLMAPRAAEKGLLLRESVAPALPEVLRGDPHRLEQILLNLVGNAIKFTEAGGVDIDLAPATSSSGQFYLRIQVTDSGAGMSADALAKLFKPFSQADASVSRHFGGTGLGLAISRRLAEMMDGDIAVSSTPGQGTTFTVRIACEIGDASELPSSENAADAAPPSGYREAHVLVAEDQEINREIIEGLLVACGIRADIVVNGRQAIDMLFERGPGAFDLVLMDIQMPVMDGLAATREIRCRPEFVNLPIVALTAHTMEHEKAISRLAGVNDHIGKPFDNPGFYRTLARWIPDHKKLDASPTAAPEGAIPADIALDGLPGLDVTDALARFGGREDRFLHWLREFCATCNAIPAQIRHEIESGHWTTAAQTAHAFKGRVGMLGMTALHGLVVALEHALREQAPAEEELAELEQALGRMHGELTRRLGNGADSDTGAGPGVTPIVWNSSYSVGVPELDDQHRRLVELINQVGDDYGPRNSFTDGLFHEVLCDMFDYTHVHFQTEEDYLGRIAYPQLAAHEREHAAFTARVMEFIEAARHGEQDRKGIHGFLLSWLVAHILESDMQYRDFVHPPEAPDQHEKARKVHTG